VAARGGSAPDAGGAALRAAALPSLDAWWSEPGRPGSLPQGWLATGMPLTVAGHVVGGLRARDDERSAPRGPWPGLVSDAHPLGWADSLAVRCEPVGGPDGGLALARTTREWPGGRRARALFGYVSGDGGVEETSLLAERGDELHALRVELESSARGPAGSLGLAGRHAWGLAARTARGAHRFDASYAQRGAADELARLAISEAGAGEAGHLRWRWEGGDRHASLRLERAYDARSSFGAALVRSRRDASTAGATLEAGRAGSRGTLDATLAWTTARVRRDVDARADRRDDALWAELRATRPARDGGLAAALGVAHASAAGGWELVPSVAYRFGAVGTRGRLSLARVVTPVWSDLASGQRAFLQRTWAGGWDVALGEGAGQARLGFVGGITHDRALVARLPLADWWLRQGVRREYGRTPFALTTLSARWDGRVLVADAEGFALALADRGSRADPSHGGRAAVGLKRALFTGDLQVDVRAEVEALAARAIEGGGGRTVPAVATLGGTLALRIADATLAFRLRNLEDRVRQEPWIDPATGAPALGLGRELRFALTWAIAD
jgi:hypothetical protein